jgi:hypothetical protein
MPEGLSVEPGRLVPLFEEEVRFGFGRVDPDVIIGQAHFPGISPGK